MRHSRSRKRTSSHPSERVVEQRYRTIKQRTGRIVQLLLMLLIMMVAYTLYLKLTNPNTLPFRQVGITAPYHFVKINRLEQVIRDNLSGGFFSLNSNKLRQSLLAIPWVSGVTLQRVWPRRLQITIMEYQPLARWNHGGVISRSGQVFYPELHTIPANLPHLIASPLYLHQVVKQFRWLKNRLQPNHIKLASLQLTPRLAWRLRLQNGIMIMVGRSKVHAHIQQFIQLYPRIIGKRAKQVQRVDLRYPNGFAIRWKNSHNL